MAFKGDESCLCGHNARYHTWGKFENGSIVSQPSVCRVVDCGCPSFQEKTVKDESESLMKTFASGAKRSSVKPRYDLILPVFLQRVAAVWTRGAEKYGEGNWQKGANDQEWIKDIPNHIIEHIYQYIAGDQSEDHLANIACNVQMLMYFDSLKNDASPRRLYQECRHPRKTAAGDGRESEPARFD